MKNVRNIALSLLLFAVSSYAEVNTDSSEKLSAVLKKHEAVMIGLIDDLQKAKYEVEILKNEVKTLKASLSAVQAGSTISGSTETAENNKVFEDYLSNKNK